MSNGQKLFLKSDGNSIVVTLTLKSISNYVHGRVFPLPHSAVVEHLPTPYRYIPELRSILYTLESTIIPSEFRCLT